MRVYCDDLAVFEETDRRGLQRLLMRVRLGQHQLIVADPEALIESEFFVQSVAAVDQAEVAELLRRQAPTLSDRALDPAARAPGPRAELRPMSEVECTREDGEPVWVLDPSTIGEWAEAPLILVLEDSNDWEFVEAVARIYEVPTVLAAKKLRFLQCDPRGGKGNVARAVEAAARSDRMFVLMDSDRTALMDVCRADLDKLMDKAQRKVKDLCKKSPNVYPFILNKREVENYLPRAILQAGCVAPERRRQFRAWDRLPAEEKDVLDMAEHFGDAPKKRWLMARIVALKDPVFGLGRAELEERTGTELAELAHKLESWL